MRKYDVRKWLHAVLDLLPVILIPVFMIYSHRHDINDGSIQVQEKEVIDFNQLRNIDVYTANYFYKGIRFTKNGNYFTFSGTVADSTSFPLYVIENTIIDPEHKYVIQADYPLSVSYYDGTTHYLNQPQIIQGQRFNVYKSVNNQEGLVLNDTGYVNVFDLTQMFGFGNEPTTITEFNNIVVNRAYDYVQSRKMLIDGDLITYDDTDIMSQFTYQLYNSVDKYFNVGNVFHLGEVYDWFNLNIFNGQAPLYIFVVYQIVLYELVMDLLFLLYALFMWFIDMIQKLMEKPLNSVK